jgi:scyllo-inosamine-4-phosphate amidinotransferase 1
MTTGILSGGRGVMTASVEHRLVDVHNEWDPLEEVIIGIIDGALSPISSENPFTSEYVGGNGRGDNFPERLPAQVEAETREDLARLSEALAGLGVIVRRPMPIDHSAWVSTPDWRSQGFYNYCPRDVLLAIGDTIIETPMVQRSRLFEPFAYKEILIDYFDRGAKWISAPKPRLLDEMIDSSAAPGARLRDLEPIFDAANVLRFGTDILYLVSDSGNERGWKWLQSVLGETYTVHPCRNLYASTHVDSTVLPLRPGLVLLNPERVTEENLPDFLRCWDKIWCPDLVDTGYIGPQAYCSPWIGMNLLVVRPDLVVVDDRQPKLICMLENHGIDVLPLRLTHSRTLGGSFHCVSLDTRRSGVLETYH